jgi:hypothetical protein
MDGQMDREGDGMDGRTGKGMGVMGRMDGRMDGQMDTDWAGGKGLGGWIF